MSNTKPTAIILRFSRGSIFIGERGPAITVDHNFNLLDEEAGNEESREQRTGHDEVAPTSKASLP